MCPSRFYQDHRVFRWIGETILGCPEPLTVGEVGFLEREEDANAGREEHTGRKEVGRIDHVLVHPETGALSWCALEMQAVYFSGAAMSREFEMLLAAKSDTLPFPAGRRHPDYRSSGPKRLMPQLQIKVPTLRRWGKKMGVVVDRSFYEALGRVEEVEDLSSCDIAWFVVRYDEEENGEYRLVPDLVHLTTLERAVEGLTAGHPVTLSTFEERIREKLGLTSSR